MFDKVNDFEDKIAEYFGSKYSVATDSCTHAIELCLRVSNSNNVSIPMHTYISVPFTLDKLKINWSWHYDEWVGYYYIKGTNIIDAAVLWKENSYISNTYMCLSFQHKKHLGLSRGGMILLDNKNDYLLLKKMVIDGRNPFESWIKQDISVVGYHYYMTPEIAQDGLQKFKKVRDVPSKKWDWNDYPNLTKLTVFAE
jgi:dTDP-4-amino-4,6-dideoxygalactose transaminase